jgi:pteridine reductase
MEQKTCLSRMGEPLDIAKTVLFLAQEATYITGQVITVDGGRTLFC